jgi:hypothetical protein
MIQQLQEMYQQRRILQEQQKPSHRPAISLIAMPV